MCPFPIVVKDMILPCGRCGNCIKARRDSWMVRMTEELKSHESTYFLTLTYAVDPKQLVKKDLQNFFKRLRKHGATFKYYAVGQYGDTYSRPHYHAIMFGLDPRYLASLEKIWHSGRFGRMRGFVHIRPITVGRIGYVTGYVVDRQNHNDWRAKPFMLCSRGIGIDYVEKFKHWHSIPDRNYYRSGKFRKALPRYYKNKLYIGEKKFEIAAKTRAALDTQLKHTIEALARTHPHPVSYYYECAENDSAAYIKAIENKKLLKQGMPKQL